MSPQWVTTIHCLTLTICCLVVGDEPESTGQTSLLKSLVSNDHLTSIADLVQHQWQRLADKLPVLHDEDLNYFKDKETSLLQATNMLTVWKVRLFG